MKNFLLIVVLLTSGLHNAEALDIPEDCPDRPESSHEARRLAGEWFNKGAALAENESYQQALEAFACSIELVEHPDTIFNAAQAAKMAGQNEDAIIMAKRYLDVAPDGPVVPEIRELIDELENSEQDSLDSQGPAGPQRKIVIIADSLDSPPVQETADDTDRAKAATLRTAGYITLGVGGAALVMGVVFQGLAAQAWSDGNETDNYKKFQKIDTKLETYQTVALVGMIAGGVAAGTGILLVILGRKSLELKNTKVLVGPNGIGIKGKF